jgi:diguanylate cyclase
MHETHHQATHDELTNLPNRYFLNEVVLRHLLTSETDVFAQTSVLFLDVDFFKKYNDEHGHVA